MSEKEEHIRRSSFFIELEDRAVKCTLCPHECVIKEGKVGVCGVRGNIDGELYSLNYGRLIAIHNDPIEKKPLFHFLPSSKSLSIATVGCNFFCINCQNYSISQVRLEGVDDRIFGDYYPPEQIIDIAKRNGSQSISYTYTEPTIFSEYALDVMRLIKDRGERIYNVFVTNGYMSDRLIDSLSGFLDAANIDLKSFSDEFYKRVCKARLSPVLNTIKRFYSLGIHIEITTLLIPSMNDSESELKQIAEFISSVSPDIPWHISRYHPDYKLNLPPTPVEKIDQAREIGQKVGLKYVYAGNVWGDEGENTYCPGCKRLLVKREGFFVEENNIVDSKCRFCGYKIYGKF